MTIRINKWAIVVLAALLSLIITYLTLQAPGCPPNIFDCYGGFKQGGWPFSYYNFEGGGVQFVVINYLNLLLDWLVFFIPIVALSFFISKKKKII